jgi:hypothetical protein
MSRSRKRTPRSGERKNRFAKRLANRRLRRLPIDDESIDFNHKQYRKAFCYYDICDYESVGTSFEEYYRRRVGMWFRCGFMFNAPFPSREQCKQDYERYFKRK